MPSTEGLKLLVRKTQPDFGEWLELLDARRRMLNPYLDNVSLGKLGGVACIGRFDVLKCLGEDTPVVQGDEPTLNLETQGIFSLKQTRTVPKGDGSLHFWGLTRSSHWILVQVEFKILRPVFAGKFDHEAATSVIIQHATPGQIVKATGYTVGEMWKELGEAVYEWRSQREKLYRAMQNLTQQIAAEEQALSLIPAQSD